MRTITTVRVPAVPALGLPPLVIEAVCPPIRRGDIYVPGWDIFLPWNELPPCKPSKYELLPDFAKLCEAWADQRVEYIPESQWSVELREEQRRRKYRGWRLWPYRSDRGELIVVTRVWSFSADPPVEERRAKVRALELYEGAAPYDPRVVPGERVERPL